MRSQTSEAAGCNAGEICISSWPRLRPRKPQITTLTEICNVKYMVRTYRATDVHICRSIDIRD